MRLATVDTAYFPRDELARHSGPVTLLFRLEQRHSLDEFGELVDEVRRWFRQHAGHERLQGLFVELIQEASAGCGAKPSGSGNPLEEMSMLATSVKAWKEQLLAEGEAKGKAEGKAEALVCLLAERFGEVEPSWQKQIREAKLLTLERWFRRAIVAPDLPSVFNPQP